MLKDLFEPPPLLFFERTDSAAEKNAVRIIEEGKWYDLDNKWRARSDGPHTKGMQYHTHLYLKGNEVVVINRDGTPSHKSDLSKAPQYVYDLIKDKGLVVKDGIEEAVVAPAFVPGSVIEAVHSMITSSSRMRRLIAMIGGPRWGGR